MFGEFASLLSIIDKILTWFKKYFRRTPQTLVSRLVLLFESHGIHRNQIPRFIGHGLTLEDVQTNEFLIKKLSDKVLDDVCKRFAIRREWLDGAEKQVYPIHYFYKHPEQFTEFIDELKLSENNLSGVLIVPETVDYSAQCVIKIIETIGYIGDKAIDRFHICTFDSYSYWKTRGYMAVCIAIAYKKDIYLNGVTLPNNIIEQHCEGEHLLSHESDRHLGIDKKRWYPEDIVHEPDMYLKGVDPENNQFGIKAALGMWLDLEKRGLMDTGMDIDYKNKFVAEYQKYQ